VVDRLEYVLDRSVEPDCDRGKALLVSFLAEPLKV
jgi:hypothetical protein